MEKVVQEGKIIEARRESLMLQRNDKAKTEEQGKGEGVKVVNPV